MVFYGLGIIASIVYLWFHRVQKSKTGKAIFFLAAVLCIMFGTFSKWNGTVDRVFANLVSVLFAMAPFALFFCSVTISLHALRRLVKRGWSRKYGVVLGSAVILLLLLGLVFLNRIWFRQEWLYLTSFLLDYLFLYLLITFIGFLISGWLHRLMRPGLQKDYIIVLGTGLLPDGSLSHLLKHRLDAALRFYRKQMENNVAPAKLIVSGGKGPDEPYSEAEVMRDYLLEQGVDAERILVECHSTNTHQNFLYSKSLMDEKNLGTVYVTNNFHVLRSGLYARQMGIQAEGIGAKTPWHYLPYALVREYIALLLIFRVFHFISATLFLLAALLFFR